MLELQEDVARLGHAGEVVMGQSPPGSTCNREGRGTPLLNGPTEFGYRSPTPVQWTEAPSRFANTGDTLFCVRGSTTGRMNVADRDYAIGRGIAAIRGKDFTDTTFIRAALESYLPELLALTTGTVFPNISGAELRNFIIPWPSKDERQEVAALLELLDSLMTSALSIRATSLRTAQVILLDASATCTIGDIATTARISFTPSRHANDVVDLYSLPAFDKGNKPERVLAESIASGKLVISDVSVLISKMNPATNRTWLVEPKDDVSWSVCSTEYVVLNPSTVSAYELFATVSMDEIGETLATGTTGTSASHQRIKAADILDANVSDPRSLTTDERLEVQALITLFQSKGRQVEALQRFRNYVLPRLLQGELEIVNYRASTGSMNELA